MPSVGRKRIRLQTLVAWMGGTCTLAPSRIRRAIGDVWMDSRKIHKNDIFIALTSERDDGHNHVGKALGAGALAAVVARKKLAAFGGSERRKLIAVREPLRAVHRAAARYRKELGIPFVAITGSSGKTTTRSLVTTVLSAGMRVGTPQGNWNNHIGVPLTVLRFSGSEDAGVLEFGANHHGEISVLSRMIKPDVAVITNIGYAHIGNFGSLTGTTNAKFEILDGMRVRKGQLLINGDDFRLRRRSAEERISSVSFGLSSSCTMRASAVTVSAGGCTAFRVDGHRFGLTMPGRHLVYSALPAIWLGRHFGMSDSAISRALRNARLHSLRGNVIRKSGVTIIVDCYNANPSSMRCGIALLNDVAEEGRACAIVGDMLELGSCTRRCHRELGGRLARAGVRRIIAVGEFARHVAAGASAAGMRASAVACVPDAAAAASLAPAMLERGDTLLLKGSRDIGLERVLKAL